jgi:biotin carboxyl carrier protein
MARTIIMRDTRGEHRVTIAEQGRVLVDEVTFVTRITAPGEVRLGEDGARVAWVAASGDLRWVFLDGKAYEIEVELEGRGRRRRAAPGQGSLSAPMPATVVRVEVSPGTPVHRGDTLVILEAMKMELPIRASSDGTVKSVSCKPGDLVQPGVALIEIE